MAKDMFPMRGNNYKVFEKKYDPPPFSDQLVDIIIPYRGAYDKVAQLIKSLIYNTRSNQFRVCVVDDCSPNSTFLDTAFDGFVNVKQIRNEEPLGFGASLEAGCQALAQEPSGLFPWLVFMHSDVEVVDGNWLISLGQTMQELKDSGVKMVGAMSDNPTIDDPRFKAERRELTEGGRKDVVLTDDIYLPLYCVLCHRDLFPRIGGFIKHYPYAGYEDRELAARMRSYNYYQAICGKSWVHHEGGASKKWMLEKNPGLIKEMKRNENRWLQDVKNL